LIHSTNITKNVSVELSWKIAGVKSFEVFPIRDVESLEFVFQMSRQREIILNQVCVISRVNNLLSFDNFDNFEMVK
jgi:hypothetical protein